MKFLSIEPLLEDLETIDLKGIDWVIVGGESGHGARPMEEEWVLRIKQQCRADNVPFFFKQWGGVRKSEAGRALNGQTYDEMPKLKSAVIPPRDKRLAMIAEVANWYARPAVVPFLLSPIRDAEFLAGF